VLVVLPEVGWLVLVPDDWLLLVPWFIVEDEFTSVDVWFAVAELLVVLLPLPMFTPGLIVAPAFTSEFATPTFAFTPRFGFTFNVEPDVVEPAVEPVPGVPLLEVPDVPLPEVPDVPLPDVPDVEPDVLPEPLSEPLELPPRPLVVPVVLPEPMPVPEPMLPVEPAVPPVVEPEVEPVLDPPVAPFKAPPAEPAVEPVVDPPLAVAESSMQSWWTGLAECSLALPVSLFASLPAFGWFSVLHGTFAVVEVLVAFVLGDCEVAFAVLPARFAVPVVLFVADVVADCEPRAVEDLVVSVVDWA